MESQAFQGMLAIKPPEQYPDSNARQDSLRPPKTGEQQGKQRTASDSPRPLNGAPRGKRRHASAKNRTAHGADGGKKQTSNGFRGKTAETNSFHLTESANSSNFTEKLGVNQLVLAYGALPE